MRVRIRFRLGPDATGATPAATLATTSVDTPSTILWRSVQQTILAPKTLTTNYRPSRISVKAVSMAVSFLTAFSSVFGDYFFVKKRGGNDCI